MKLNYQFSTQSYQKEGTDAVVLSTNNKSSKPLEGDYGYYSPFRGKPSKKLKIHDGSFEISKLVKKPNKKK